MVHVYNLQLPGGIDYKNLEQRTRGEPQVPHMPLTSYWIHRLDNNDGIGKHEELGSDQKTPQYLVAYIHTNSHGKSLVMQRHQTYNQVSSLCKLKCSCRVHAGQRAQIDWNITSTFGRSLWSTRDMLTTDRSMYPDEGIAKFMCHLFEHYILSSLLPRVYDQQATYGSTLYSDQDFWAPGRTMVHIIAGNRKAYSHIWVVDFVRSNWSI